MANKKTPQVPQAKPAMAKKRARTAKRIETLQAFKSQAVKDYINVKNTDHSYKYHLQHAKHFLSKIIEGWKKKGVNMCEQGVVAGELAVAFNMLNRFSVFVLESYITQKCFHESLKHH